MFFRLLKMLINCSVCLGDINLFDMEVSILNCGHFFHSQCLNNWLTQQMNCPECRAIVTRGNFVRNIFPKVNEETGSKLKSLKDRYESLQNEHFLLKMGNLELNKSKLIFCSISEQFWNILLLDYIFYIKSKCFSFLIT